MLFIAFLWGLITLCYQVRNCCWRIMKFLAVRMISGYYGAVKFRFTDLILSQFFSEWQDTVYFSTLGHPIISLIPKSGHIVRWVHSSRIEHGGQAHKHPSNSYGITSAGKLYKFFSKILVCIDVSSLIWGIMFQNEVGKVCKKSFDWFHVGWREKSSI